MIISLLELLKINHKLIVANASNPLIIQVIKNNL
jgi:hypothetical protein